MADEENLKQEELQDDQLDQVAGGSFREQLSEESPASGVGNIHDIAPDCHILK